VAFWGASAAKEAHRPADKPAEGGRITPEPLAAVLPALSALGAISSIAAIHWVAEDRTTPRKVRRRKVGVALRDLENDCLKLQEIFKRLIRTYRTYAGTEANPKPGAGGAISHSIKFGIHGLTIAEAGYPAYQAIIADIAQALASATTNAVDVMGAIEDGEITPPERIFFGFAEQQERLNQLLVKRESLKGCVGVGLSVSEKLTELVRSLHKHMPQ
jgi:hypothetical protein